MNWTLFLLGYVLPTILSIVGGWLMYWNQLHLIGDFLAPEDRDGNGPGITCWIPVFNLFMAFISIIVIGGSIMSIRIRK